MNELKNGIWKKYEMLAKAKHQRVQSSAFH